MIVAACLALSGIGVSTQALSAKNDERADRTLASVMADLAAGGSVIVMRHANSPDGQIAPVGLTANCNLGAGRGLDAKGFFQARFIGDFLKSEGVSLSAAFTSDMCRAWDTARLVAAGVPVMPSEALKSTDRSTADRFKTIISSAFVDNPTGNILLVTHANIVPLYTDWSAEEEIPSGVFLIVDPESWTVREKLNLDIDLSVD